MYIRVYGGEGKNTLGLIIGKALVDAGFKDVFFVGHEGALRKNTEFSGSPIIMSGPPRNKPNFFIGSPIDFSKKSGRPIVFIVLNRRRGLDYIEIRHKQLEGGTY